MLSQTGRQSIIFLCKKVKKDKELVYYFGLVYKM